MAKQKILGVFGITMITITSVDTIRGLPTTALFGTELIVLFIMITLGFLLPCAFISAELSVMMPKSGGVYLWVKEAFGEKFGLLAIWFQWIENVIWYPLLLSFIAGTFAYLISPELTENKLYLTTIITLTFWSLTAMNLQGVKISAWFSEFCGIAGVIFPLALVIILGGIWFFTGQPLAIDFSTNKLWPDMLDPNYWTSLTFVVFGLTGIEIATAHAHDVQNPARVYPIALFLSVFIIVTCTLLGSLSIAITIPQQKLNVVSGIMQAIEQFFTVFHLRALLPIVALSIIVGSLGSINNWIISPSRGLVVALRDENLAPSLQLPNKHGAPAKLLIYQAVLVTLLSCIFVLMPSIKSSYWILTVLASQAYMLMYLIVFSRDFHPLMP